MTRRFAALALVIAAALAAGCGEEASEAVRSVTAEAGAALAELRQGLSQDLDRAESRVDALVKDAKAGGQSTLADARERADRAIDQARGEADQAIAEARAAGDRTQEELDQLRADADQRIKELRDKVDQELPDSP